jgi:hypothetical protein
LSGTQNTNYAVYNNVDFGSGVSQFQARVAVDSYYLSGNPRIEIRLGSTSGTLLGTLNLTSTGGWTTYQTQTCNISSTTGVRNLYLVFKTDMSGGYVCNLNWFKFS